MTRPCGCPAAAPNHGDIEPDWACGPVDLLTLPRRACYGSASTSTSGANASIAGDSSRVSFTPTGDSPSQRAAHPGRASRARP